MGHEVTVLDAAEKPGGSMRYKVPKEQLPEEILDAEIDIMVKMGLKFKMECKIGIDVTLDQIREGFDAVFENYW